jgi:diaminopimelate decarboxylase
MASEGDCSTTASTLGDTQTVDTSLFRLLANERKQHRVCCENVAAIVQKVIQEMTLLAAPPNGLQTATSNATPDGHNQMQQHALDLFDLTAFDARLDELSTAFESVLKVHHENDNFENGPCFIHALAVKANPVRGILSRAAAAQTRASAKTTTTPRTRFGAECASYPEVMHALSLNCFESPRSIIYDSPCKPMDELAVIMRRGCYVNLDNLDEVEKVNSILHASGHTGMEEQYEKQFGLRISPVVAAGESSIFACTSTGTTLDSKFGLALLSDDDVDDTSTRERLVALYRSNPWLQGIHVHVGSQGCSLDMLVTGVERVVKVALDMNAALGRRQIQVIDIGGGLPTVYDGRDQEAYRFETYVNELKKHVPQLFSSANNFTIITEFGRSIFVKCGITISRVETVKSWLLKEDSSISHGKQITDRQQAAAAAARIAVIHVGANQFLRTAYLPNEWKHSISVFDSTGNPKGCEYDNGNDHAVVVPFLLHDIAGPLCFAGDYLAKRVWLPEIQAGDYLVIHDTGGYTMSMYSRYNSRCASGIYGYEYYSKDDDDTEEEEAEAESATTANSRNTTTTIRLSILKRPETVEEALSFWGLDEPTAM